MVQTTEAFSLTVSEMRSFQSKCGQARPSERCRGRSLLTPPGVNSDAQHPSACGYITPGTSIFSLRLHISLLRRSVCTFPLFRKMPSFWIRVQTHAHARSCPTLCDPMDCSLPGFSVHGILQASPGDLPNQRIKPTPPASPILAGRSLPLATWSRLVTPFIVMTSAKTLPPNRFTL